MMSGILILLIDLGVIFASGYLKKDNTMMNIIYHMDFVTATLFQTITISSLGFHGQITRRG